MGLYYSLTNWNRFGSHTEFVGLDNYRSIFGGDRALWQAVKNTVVFTVVTIVTKTVLGLLLALLVSKGIRRLSTAYRAVIYLPAILPMIAVGIVFKSILHPKTGALNTFLRFVGLDGLAQRWLTDPAIALYSIIAVDTWKGVGFIMVLLLAGIESIPQEYYEAARIDGASGIRRVPVHHPAAAQARADRHDGAEPVVRAEGVRQRVRLDERRAGLRDRNRQHDRVQGVRTRPLRGEHRTVDRAVRHHDHRRICSSSVRCTDRSTMSERPEGRRTCAGR